MRRSKSPYLDNWKEIATKIKENAGWCCIRCGIPHQKGHVLTVHHLDMDPANNEWWNLPPLCQQCHLSIQGRVIMERVWLFEHSDWFMPFVAGYYAHQYGMPEERAYVMEHLDELIALGQGRLSISGQG